MSFLSSDNKGRLQAIGDGDLSPEAINKIAAELGVSEADVVSMNQRLAGPDYSLNTPPDGTDAEGAGEWLTMLADEAPDQETVAAECAERRQRCELVRGALKHLSPRECDIILERNFKDKPTTLVELSDRDALSPERVRQIEGRALEKMRRTVRIILRDLCTCECKQRRQGAQRSAARSSRAARVLQTGAGAVLKALRVRAGSGIAVFGAGAVGLAAIMAVRIAGAIHSAVGLLVTPKLTRLQRILRQSKETAR